MEIITFTNQFNNNFGECDASVDNNEDVVIEALSKRFADELKKAKRQHFASGEVLLPTDLTKALARDVVTLAEAEPYGLRGCTIFINFEGFHENVNRKLCMVNCDPSTPSTFELYLTLKQTVNGWNHFLPQFLKKMTRIGTVMISSEYDLKKNKLYRSYND